MKQIIWKRSNLLKEQNQKEYVYKAKEEKYCQKTLWEQSKSEKVGKRTNNQFNTKKY